jgi:hypothetical protein
MPVEVELVQSGLAAIKGVVSGARVVVEGAQNVRKDSTIAEAGPAASGSVAEKGGASPAGKDTSKPGK